MVTVRARQADDVEPLLDIVRRLPEYFTKDVPDKVAADLATHETWVAAEADVPCGFVVIDRTRSELTAEILWMAVDAARRGSGIGTELCRTVLSRLRSEGVRLVEVKTLDRSAGYLPYEGTRHFYERRGFVQIDTIDQVPSWEPGNPCAIYVAALTTTA